MKFFDSRNFLNKYDTILQNDFFLQIDNYEPEEYHFDIKDSADAQFNNIQYMYIGKNESMTDGFVGCVSRVEFDDLYPLKFLFQQNPPPNVKSLGPCMCRNSIR